jgi:hypothetical protein
MVNVINTADDEFEVDKLDAVGPTMAICESEGLVFNHQTAHTDKILTPKISTKEEADALSEMLKDKDVTICLNVNGMFEDYVDDWDDVADLDEEDWYLEGTVLDVKEGQLKLETDEDESEWIPFKHIDTIELSEGSEEPYEYEND